MENEHIETMEPEQEAPVYTPRPRWQIVAAWIGLGIMIVSVALYYWHIASGGRMR
jgi:hypothetical protein